MLGNDVIDLGARATAVAATHPRFDERVFSEAEFEALAATRNADAKRRLRWTLWAAKEAGYKALHRLDPSAVFSPRRFEVTLGASALGSIAHGTWRFELVVRRTGDALHAVAQFAQDATTRVVSDVAEQEHAGGNESVAVRHLACRSLAPRLGLDPLRIGFGRARRMPTLLVDGEPIGATLSLSHHGRFLAFACRLPGPEAAS
jgi:4'-phosphopantetheinyl transferase superfamily